MFIGVLSTFGGVNVWTSRYNNSRDGLNAQETILTPANVGSSAFGLLFRHSVDGQVHAQPLLVQGLSFGPLGVHDALFVGTENDVLYAFDANSADGTNAQALWIRDFRNPAMGINAVTVEDAIPNHTAGVQPYCGITATPVIDVANQTIYVEVFTEEGTNFIHRLHALDLTTGNDKPNSPVAISATVTGNGVGSVGGVLSFLQNREYCRSALTLAQPKGYGSNVVFLSYSAINDGYPGHGWVIACDATTLQKLGVFCSTPNGTLGSFWAAGGGSVADGDGNLFVASGNGTYDSTQNNYADSVIKLTTDHSGLHLSDWFTPYNQAFLQSSDLDLGGCGVVALPDSAGSPAHPRLLLAAGKEGRLYLLDRDQMGKFNSVDDSQIPQSWWPYLPSAAMTGVQTATPGFFSGNIFNKLAQQPVKSYSISSALVQTNPVFHGSANSYFGLTPTISANGNTNAIIWTLDFSAYESGPAILYATDAFKTNAELYKSFNAGVRDTAAIALRHTIPVVANGKVYFGGVNEVDVYGLGHWTATPTITPSGGNFGDSLKVSMSDNTPGEVIHFTLDGATPTIFSPTYLGPFSISNTARLQARAFASNSIPGGIASANFISTNTIGNGTGLFAQYWSNQLGTFNGSPNLTRIDPTVNFPYILPATNFGNTFTARWTGSIQAAVSGIHTFYLESYGGFHLWIGGQKIVDYWYDNNIRLFTGSIYLISGQKYAVQLEHFQSLTPYEVLSWSSPASSKTVVPQSQLYPPVAASGPSITIAATPGTNLLLGGALTISAQATSPVANVARVDFLLDGVISNSVITPPYVVTFTGLTQGTHAISANATDGNGNMTPSQILSITVRTNDYSAYGVSNRPIFPAFLNFPTNTTGTFPALLSTGGVFSDTPSFTLTNGWIAFTPAAPFWSDGAIKTRWFGIPYTGGAIAPTNQIAYSQDGNWDFPPGSVFLKHFGLVTNQTFPSVLRRLETRVLVYYGGGVVAGASYRWRADGSDADLVTYSQTEKIDIASSNGIKNQTWYYPSPSDCLACHSTAAGGILGVSKMRQQNVSTFYSETGIGDNQLRVLNHLGLLNPAIDETTISGLPHYASAVDAGASLELRARSFLDVNCAYCHQPGGSGRAGFDLRITTPLTNANLINGSVVATFDLPNAAAIVPGNPLSSTVYHRVDTATPGVMMPPLARSIIDESDQAILGKWIYSLASTNPSIVGRYLYTNNTGSPNFLDDLALESDKVAMLPGGTVGPSNYTTYSQGLNGVMVDLTTLPMPGTLSLADFAFSMSAFDSTSANESRLEAWSPAPAPSGISVRIGDGVGGSDRIDFAWPSGSISGKWLRVSVLATTNTGLTSPDVFYFGNAPKVVPQINSLPTASSIVYGQSLLASTLIGGLATTPGNFSFSAASTVPNAGIYLASATFTPTDTDNYTTASLQVPVIVNPAPSSVTVSGGTQYNYNGLGQGPNNTVIVGSSAAPVLNYVSIDGISYPPSLNSPTNVGSYMVTASMAADSNHSAATSTPLAFTIRAIPLTITANIQSKTYGRTMSLDGGPTSFTAVGLTNSETVGKVTLTASGGTAADAAVGTYSLTPSAAMGGSFQPSNYIISYIAGLLIVTGDTSLNNGVDVPLLNPFGITVLISAIVGLAVRASRRWNKY